MNAPSHEPERVSTSATTPVDQDAKRFALFMTVLVVLLGLGAFLVLGVLIFEVEHPEERPPAPPKYSIPSFTPPEQAQ
jgi:hypothetical protein